MSPTHRVLREASGANSYQPCRAGWDRKGEEEHTRPAVARCGAEVWGMMLSMLMVWSFKAAGWPHLRHPSTIVLPIKLILNLPIMEEAVALISGALMKSLTTFCG